MASADQSNLNWIRNNQRKLRADLYSGLQDRMGHDGGVDMENVGCVVILPSFHKGSAWYMQQLLQDSLAICQENKKPDLFLTMTANGNWQEIVENILPGQTATDRPDLVAQVFHAKQQALCVQIYLRSAWRVTGCGIPGCRKPCLLLSKITTLWWCSAELWGSKL